MTDTPDNATRQHILHVAEQLFATRGYAAVKLRDIADAVGMKHASLYYYVPGGKEQLFIQTFEHSFERHQQGIMQAIDAAGPMLRDQLYAIADWFVTQPAMAIDRIQHGDRPKISQAEIGRLSTLAYNALRLPIVTALQHAQSRDEIHIADFDLAAMAFISLIQSTRNIPNTDEATRQAIGYQLVDMILNGWRKR